MSFFLGQKKGTLWRFWTELQEKAKAQDLIPLLIAKQNGLPDIVVSRGFVLPGPGCPMPVSQLSDGASVYLLDKAFPIPKPRLRQHGKGDHHVRGNVRREGKDRK